MVPPGDPTEKTVQTLLAKMEAGDTIIDGGNSYFKDDVRRETAERPKVFTMSMWEPAAACGESIAATA